MLHKIVICRIIYFVLEGFILLIHAWCQGWRKLPDKLCMQIINLSETKTKEDKLENKHILLR